MISRQCQLRPWFIHSTVMIHEYLISEGTEADRFFGLMNYNHCSKLLARFFKKFVSILNHGRLFTHKNTENGWQLWKLFSRVKIYEKRHANNIGILLLFFPFKSLGSCIMRFGNSNSTSFQGWNRRKTTWNVFQNCLSLLTNDWCRNLASRRLCASIRTSW